MADKVKIWFDAEADFLEVRFSDAASYEKAAKHDAVMELWIRSVTSSVSASWA